QGPAADEIEAVQAVPEPAGLPRRVIYDAGNLAGRSIDVDARALLVVQDRTVRGRRFAVLEAVVIGVLTRHVLEPGDGQSAQCIAHFGLCQLRRTPLPVQ